MRKKKSLFISFEGIEGSGKSYQSQKLYKKLKKENISVVKTREPGGTIGAERIRDLIYIKEKKSVLMLLETVPAIAFLKITE